MTILLQLPDETEKKLARMAAAAGFADVTAFVHDLVEHSVDRETTEPELRQEFDSLAAQWKRERGATSMARRMAEHPSYRRIVAMGDRAVPLILADLERQPDHWFIALHEITGASPVPEESRGRLNEM